MPARGSVNSARQVVESIQAAIGVGLEVVAREANEGWTRCAWGEMGMGTSRRIAVVVDGFIATAAAMLAVELCPRLRGYLIAAHRSVEVGHRVVLESSVRRTGAME